MKWREVPNTYRTQGIWTSVLNKQVCPFDRWLSRSVQRWTKACQHHPFSVEIVCVRKNTFR